MLLISMKDTWYSFLGMKDPASSNTSQLARAQGYGTLDQTQCDREVVPSDLPKATFQQGALLFSLTCAHKNVQQNIGLGVPDMP